MAALKSANKGLKGMMKTVKIQEIDNLQDDMMDLMEVSDEIQEFLGRSYNVSDDIDEEDLMGELDALEADMGFETEDEGVPSYLQPDNEPDYDDELNLPSAPTGHAIPARKVNNHTVHLFTFIMDHGITWEAASELLNEKQKDVSGSSANGFYDSKREWLGRRHFLLAIEGSVGTFKILRPAIVETLRYRSFETSCWLSHILFRFIICLRWFCINLQGDVHHGAEGQIQKDCVIRKGLQWMEGRV